MTTNEIVSDSTDEDTELSKHDLLLVQIYMAAQDAAEYLATSDANYLMSVVFPRYKARFRWRGRAVRLWRLDLVHPLWIGADGEIYRGYDVDTWEDWEYPQYLMRAEIEHRGIKGLERVLRAVQALVPPIAPDARELHFRTNTEQ